MLARQSGQGATTNVLMAIDSRLRHAKNTLKAIIYGLSKVFVMQFFMALHLADIVTIQQPVDLLTGQA